MKKILIVDDDEGILLLLSATLERAGYDCASFESSPKALETFSSGIYPVVLSDIVMPEMDGLELLSRVKKISPDTQIILITGQATLEKAMSAIKEGAFGFLRKPFEPDELVAQVNNAYEKWLLIEKNKRLLELNEQIIHQIHQALIVVSPDGKIKKINHAMEKLLGYAQNELLGKPLASIFSPESENTGWRNILKESHITDRPVSFRAVGGGEIKSSLSGAILKDAAGDVIGFLGTVKI